MSQKEQNFSKLVKENQGLIIKVARMYTNTPDDQQDLFQEIVLQLWRSYDTFKGNSKISTWMYRVALNTAITLFRKTTRTIKTDELADFHQPIDDENDENRAAAECSAAKAELIKAIEELLESKVDPSI